MEEVSIPSGDDGSDEFKQFLTQYDAPAYIRRARAVQGALEDLLACCRRQRTEWLKMVRLRLGLLRALAGDWHNLRPLLADDDQLDILRRLHDELNPQLRTHIDPSASIRILQRSLHELCESLEHFNRRWRVFLPMVDRGTVNELREGYNRYYVLEKECAVRSARVARQGFTPLPPLTTEDLAVEFPLLPVPQLRN